MASVIEPATVAARGELVFEGFFESNYEPLLRLMYLVTGNRSEAEDLAQEAFVRVYERWDRVRGVENPEGYLYRTALNAHRSRLRRLTVAMRNLLVRPEPERDLFEAAHDRDLIRRALSGLPTGQRQAVVLVEWLGLSDVEAAGILRVAPVTVRVRISRARRTLRETLQGDGK
jgi:RNA polymerase sigma-70 factor (ECF subfamily)